MSPRLAGAIAFTKDEPDFYASRLPGPPDILLMVDLDDRSVSCYTAPRDGAYQKLREYRSGQSIAPEALPQCAISVDVWLAD